MTIFIFIALYTAIGVEINVRALRGQSLAEMIDEDAPKIMEGIKEPQLLPWSVIAATGYVAFAIVIVLWLPLLILDVLRGRDER